MNSGWLAIVGGAYAVVLIFMTLHARRSNRDAEDYMLAGSNLGTVIGAAPGTTGPDDPDDSRVRDVHV